MQNILLPFYDDDVSQRAFGVCTELVRRTGGHLEGLFALRRPRIMEGDSEMIVEAHYRQLDDECRRVAAEARAGTADAASHTSYGKPIRDAKHPAPVLRR